MTATRSTITRSRRRTFAGALVAGDVADIRELAAEHFTRIRVDHLEGSAFYDHVVVVGCTPAGARIRIDVPFRREAFLVDDNLPPAA